MLRVLFLVTILSQTTVGLLLLCQKPCRYGNQTFCGHIPCPLPPCDKPLVLTPGDCCQHCPDSVETRDIAPQTTTVCPANCTAGGTHYCFPIPCPLPPCVDPVKSAGECCEHCPNGPNCEMRGRVIPQGKSYNFGDQDCTCKFGGHLGGIECVYV